MPLDSADGPNAWVDRCYRQGDLPQNAFGANSSNSTVVGGGPSAAPAEQTGQQMEGLTANLALALKIVRLAHGWSQRQFALVLGVPRAYISKIEQGHVLPTVTNFTRLALGLETTPYALIAFAEALCGV